MNKLLLSLFVFGCFYTTHASSEEAIENPPIDLLVCDDDNDGFATFDLTQNDAIVLGTQNPADFTITYHLSQADAVTDAFPVPSEAFVGSDETIFVRVEEVANTNLFEIGVFNLIVTPIPDVPSDLGSIELCSEDGVFAVFDLTIYEATATGGDPNLIVTYFESSADLLILSPEAYTNVVNPELINVRVTNLITNCSATSTITLIVNPLPVPTQPALYELCDDIESGSDVDELATFDLTSRDDEITGGNIDLTVSYHLTQNHANAGSPTLPNLYQNVSASSQTVWARVQDTVSGCYDLITLTLAVNPLPSPSPIGDVILCDDNNDGIVFFDLTALEDAILNGETSASLSFHGTLANAELEVPDIPAPEAYANSTNPQTIYVRATDIDSNTTTACFRVITITLIVNPLPPISTPLPDLIQCNDGSNQAVFDLTQNEAAIFGTLDPTLYTLTYHENQADAEADALPIGSPESYFVTAPGTTIWIRLEDNITECATVTSFNTTIVPAPEVSQNTPFNYTFCEEFDGDDSQGEIDLTTLADDAGFLVAPQNTADFAITYHNTAIEAENGAFPIDQSGLFTVTDGDELFFRIENLTAGCVNFGSIFFTVESLPELNLIDFVICNDDDDPEGIAIFNLPVLIQSIINDETIGIGFYESLEDLANGVLISDSNYTNTSNPQTIIAEIESFETGCIIQIEIDLIVEDCNDMDNDGVLDEDEDLNNNGNLDDDDTDNDDIPNYLDDDDDGDLVMTIDEITGIGAGSAPQDFIDTDDDMIENYLDDDDDGDNVLTIDEDYNDSGSPLDDDINMNDIPDFLDPEVALSTDEFMVANFTIYPNPVIDQLSIKATIPFTTVTIYDITGKIVQQLEQPSQLEQTLYVSELKTGLYFIRIDTQETLYKLLKR